jgi:hypothetical protein
VAKVVDKGFQLIFTGSPLEGPAAILVLLVKGGLVKKVLRVASSVQDLSMRVQTVALEGRDKPNA